MWSCFLIFSLLLHECTPFPKKYVADVKTYFDIVGIFKESDKVPMLALNESCANVDENSLKLRLVHVVPNRTDSYAVWNELCNTAARPIAVFGPQSEISDIAVRHQCARAHIPHLQAVWQPYDPDLVKFKPITINFYPDSDDIAIAYAKLLSLYGWTKFAALYEDDFGLLRIQKIIAEYSTDWPLFVRKLNPDETNYEVFKGLRDYKVDRVLLDCQGERIMKYMNEAKQMNIVDNYRHFIFVSLDGSVAATDLLLLDSNSTFLSLTEYDQLNDTQNPLSTRVPIWKNTTGNPHVTEFKLDAILLNDLANHVIKSINGDDVEKMKHPPSICLNSEENEEPWEYGATLQNNILNTITTGVSGRIQFDENGKRINYTLFVNELYMKQRRTIGRWNAIEPDHIHMLNERGRENATETTKKHFIIISRRARPYFDVKQPCVGDNCSEEDDGEEFEGFSVDLVREIFKVINTEFQPKREYTYEFRNDNQSYGAYDPKTKKWDGLIGDLLDKKADLAVCDLTITEERKKAVDFSVPFMSLGISILFTQEHKVTPGMFSFLNPYTFDVWIHTATAYCIVSLVLFICARISPADWENPQPCDKDPEELENIWNFKNCAWMTMGSIMTQGCDILPKALGSRWVCATWWFFAMIVCQTYIATLSASMTSALEDEPINSVEDLAKQNKILYGAIKGGSTYNFFKNSNDKTYQQIFQFMNKNPAVLVNTNDEGEKRVLSEQRKNRYAFFMESTTIEYKLKRNCNLKKVGGQLDSKDYGIAMPANSPFRTDINRAILRLKELTDLDRLKNKWWNDKYNATDCPKEDASDVEGDLEMENLMGLFVVLVFGLFVCLFITAAEFMDEVRNIVVREQVTHKEAFIQELKASLNFFQLQKPVLRNPSRAPSVISDKSQLEEKQARRTEAMEKFTENFMDMEKMTQAPSVVSDKSQLEEKQARRTEAMEKFTENFMDMEKMTQ
ncbi:ligand-gated ion channel domain-containing protein [Phthorimaea operculella]|nr:ligand-gated ion channel domain-containing protein [Phthorimaea operculella]